MVLLYLVCWPFCEYLANQTLHAQAVCDIGFSLQVRIFQAQDREIPSTIAYSALPPPPPQYLVRNGPLLASTIDEEHFAFLSLIYIIFSVATLVCIKLKYNTRSCSYCLEFISFH